MYAWEKPFSKIVSLTRKLEIKKIIFSSYVRAAYLAIIVFTERLTLYFTLITFVLIGNDLTANVTFEMSTYFNMLQLTASLFFPQALIMIGETMVSMNRLEVHVVALFPNSRGTFKSIIPQSSFPWSHTLFPSIFHFNVNYLYLFYYQLKKYSTTKFCRIFNLIQIKKNVYNK